VSHQEQCSRHAPFGFGIFSVYTTSKSKDEPQLLISFATSNILSSVLVPFRVRQMIFSIIKSTSAFELERRTRLDVLGRIWWEKHKPHLRRALVCALRWEERAKDVRRLTIVKILYFLNL
jgi:hypothetical protein